MEDLKINAIVEYKDATPRQRAITLCNSGIMSVRTDVLIKLLPEIKPNNAGGEYYLTDLVALAGHYGLKVSYILCDEVQAQGVNNRTDLLAVNNAMQSELREKIILNGNNLLLPSSTFFCTDTIMGNDCNIGHSVVFGNNVQIGNNVTIGNNCNISNCKIADNVQIEDGVIISQHVTINSGSVIKSYSYLEGKIEIGSNVQIGPFARIRPDVQIDDNAKIGNFVEIKNSHLGQGAYACHLSYIGDATIGSNTNIGAGTITCNYDGVNKNKTNIGSNVFIGSNTSLVAPIDIEDESFVAAGSVITKAVASGDLAIERTQQRNISGGATKFKQKTTNKKHTN
jgi:bifunctional UDP-N-acetylglucosamine pyrophosphorylase/glucosamine-1-phosphate N-acetyltransferase